MFGRAQQKVSRTLTAGEAKPWDRGKLVAVLAAAVVVCLLAMLGIGLALYYTLRPGTHPRAGAAGGPSGSSSPAAARPSSTGEAGSAQYAEDTLAARPMPLVGLAAAEPGPVSVRAPGVIDVPKPTLTGPANVPSGFPHTPAGALAQMAAIDQTAMQSGTLSGVRTVITAWAAPRGPTPDTWSGVAAMAQFLNAAGLSGGGSSQLALVVTPLMGLIKGTVGPDFVIPCVDFQFDATLASTQHVAVADCERMIWRDDRWLIGPGPEPADPPSVWPDTDTAITVGYQDLRHG